MGKRRSHSTLPGRSVERDDQALAARRIEGVEPLSSSTALPRTAEVDDGHEHAGRPRRPSASRRRRAARGRRSTRTPWQRPDVVAVQPDFASSRAGASSRDPTRSRARPCPRRTRACRRRPREDRRRLEVVVADVVRCDLVVPEQPSVARVEHEQRVRVEGRARETRRRSAAPATLPTAPDSSSRRTACRARRPTPDTRARRRRPRADSATASRSSRTSSARRPSPRRGVDRPAAERRVADGADEDEAVPHDRSDVDELLGPLVRWRRQSSRPVRASSAKASESVAPYTRPPSTASPFGPSFRAPYRRAQRSAPVRAVEREDVAPQILNVDRVARRRSDVDEKMPEKLGFAVNRNRQRTRRCATLPASIREPAAARVPARSPFGSVQTAAARPPHPVRTLATTADATATETRRAGRTPTEPLLP